MTVVRCDLDRGIASLDTLDEAERARAAAFVFDRHRRRYIAAHAFLRAVLATATGASPAALRFAATEHGKPYLAQHASLAFNMSHSDHIAYVAIARSGDIGVDVELHRHMNDIAGVARLVFSPLELEEVSGASADEQVSRFLRAWTRKEAYVKALGVGLGAALTAITVRTVTEEIVVPPQQGISDAAFHIRSLDCVAGEYAAIATSTMVSAPIEIVEHGS